MNKKRMSLHKNYKISYPIYGKGGNTIVLFHGLVGCSELDPEILFQIDIIFESV